MDTPARIEPEHRYFVREHHENATMKIGDCEVACESVSVTHEVHRREPMPATMSGTVDFVVTPTGPVTETWEV